MSVISRRALLGAAAATAALPMLPAGFAEAAAPFRNDLPPAWHRFKWGEFEATVISDGSLPLGKPQDSFVGPGANQIPQMLSNEFLDPNAATLEQNILVLNTGRQLLLFDTGMGESMGADSKMFGPTTGRMLANLRAAGIQPEQIDMVVATHAHCDHVWGLVNAAGQRVFPNAQVAINEADVRFWTDDGNKKGPAFMGPFIEGAKKNLNAYRDRLVMVKDGQEVAPGVVALFSPGHTVGHTCYAITSGGRTMVNTGDLAHHQVLLLRHPMMEFSFDTDPKQSAQTRSRMLDRLATDKHAVLSYHFPWPGLGHVRREGEGFAWVSLPTNVTTL
ncbi:MBL fold metallo-hydrolase [Paracraurococcus ruber]|uniref:MBL fold metallo-hydrolase n=1 Tax=Paracraurococcus ruber TaxID=77675 RepID=A0ABS1D4C2_9PROT|nr:MBL fold metallo-hydrolase [Paracraurococcus ruber]MBK1661300.1 MBL fold metallo-hydrolase [Paracraurococcus ruber]TDG23505.1 MBL fold metallo-hydrolase [Paracraurococcus ruber]